MKSVLVLPLILIETESYQNAIETSPIIVGNEYQQYQKVFFIRNDKSICNIAIRISFIFDLIDPLSKRENKEDKHKYYTMHEHIFIAHIHIHQ